MIANVQMEAILNRIGRVFLAGGLAILPLVITAFAMSWLVSIVTDFIGPQTSFGRLLKSLGAAIGVSVAPYVVGVLLLVVAIYALGLVVESRIGPWLVRALEAVVARIPLVSRVYDLTKRFTSIVDAKDGGQLASMRPVWCFFGGEPSAAVLALLPSSQTVRIGEHDYLGILVPSAPVPVGGALVYVPQSWVRPANSRVDELMTVYLSMGVTPPRADIEGTQVRT